MSGTSATRHHAQRCTSRCTPSDSLNMAGFHLSTAR
jgi:hypothetical protein